MGVLTEAEEKYLDGWELFLKKNARSYPIFIGIFISVMILLLFVGFKLKDCAPIESRENFCFAFTMGGWLILGIAFHLRFKKLFVIVQKLRKK